MFSKSPEALSTVLIRESGLNHIGVGQRADQEHGCIMLMRRPGAEEFVSRRREGYKAGPTNGGVYPITRFFRPRSAWISRFSVIRECRISALEVVFRSRTLYCAPSASRISWWADTTSLKIPPPVTKTWSGRVSSTLSQIVDAVSPSRTAVIRMCGSAAASFPWKMGECCSAMARALRAGLVDPHRRASRRRRSALPGFRCSVLHLPECQLRLVCPLLSAFAITPESAVSRLPGHLNWVYFPC